jgi:hypothetical protein
MIRSRENKNTKTLTELKVLFDCHRFLCKVVFLNSCIVYTVFLTNSFLLGEPAGKPARRAVHEHAYARLFTSPQEF